MTESSKPGRLEELQGIVQVHSPLAPCQSHCDDCQAFWEQCQLRSRPVFMSLGRIGSSTSIEIWGEFLPEQIIPGWRHFVGAQQISGFVKTAAKNYHVSRLRKHGPTVPIDGIRELADQSSEYEKQIEDDLWKQKVATVAIGKMLKAWRDTYACPLHAQGTQCVGDHLLTSVEDVIHAKFQDIESSRAIPRADFSSEKVSFVQQYLEELGLSTAGGGDKKSRDRLRKRVSRGEGLCFDWWLHTAWSAVVELDPLEYLQFVKQQPELPDVLSVVHKRIKVTALESSGGADLDGNQNHAASSALLGAVDRIGHPRLVTLNNLYRDQKNNKYTTYPRAAVGRILAGVVPGTKRHPERTYDTDDIQMLIVVHKPDIARDFDLEAGGMTP